MKSRLIFSVMVTVFIALFARGLSPILAQDATPTPSQGEVKQTIDLLGKLLDCKTLYTAGKVVNLADAYSKGPEMYRYFFSVSNGQTPEVENPIGVNRKVGKLLDIFAVTCITANLVIDKFDEPPAP